MGEYLCLCFALFLVEGLEVEPQRAVLWALNYVLVVVRAGKLLDLEFVLRLVAHDFAVAQFAGIYLSSIKASC